MDINEVTKTLTMHLDWRNGGSVRVGDLESLYHKALLFKVPVTAIAKIDPSGTTVTFTWTERESAISKFCKHLDENNYRQYKNPYDNYPNKDKHKKPF